MSAANHSIKSALIDLSGCLHVENAPIAGSIEALQKLRENEVKVKFITNTTKESKRGLFKKLTRLGFTLSIDEIYTSLHATRDLLRKEKMKPMMFIEDAAWEDFQEFRNVKEEEINAVVIGLVPSRFDYYHLNKAFRLIMGGAKLIAIHEARYFKQQDGLSLGPGPFVRALEFATDATATAVGKPNVSFFRDALGQDDARSAVMIGDDVKDDISGAQELGMKGFLVKTGKYIYGDENKIYPPPFAVCENFAEAVDRIIAINTVHFEK